MTAHLVNIYCDESCHLELDGHSCMVLGALSCPAHKAPEIAERMRQIREDHGVSRTMEVKWSKVSPSKVAFYRSLIDYFFDDDDLSFRTLVVPDKKILRHVDFGQSHDDFYYKMYFLLIHRMLNPQRAYHIYLDIKDSRSASKAEKLRDVLCSAQYDFPANIVRRIQHVRSDEVQQVQLADLLIGSVGYANRGLSESPAKTSLVERVRSRSGYGLTRSTGLAEHKFNVFVWKPNDI